MHHPNKSFPIALIFMCLISCLLGCEEEDTFQEFSCRDTDSDRLLIVPAHPDRTDTILFIENICGNESDVILNIQGRQIEYKRYFNSLMMMPCIPQADTTLIGPLSPGLYRLVHIMIDKNHFLTDSISLSDTLCLQVK